MKKNKINFECGDKFEKGSFGFEYGDKFKKEKGSCFNMVGFSNLSEEEKKDIEERKELKMRTVFFEIPEDLRIGQAIHCAMGVLEGYDAEGDDIDVFYISDEELTKALTDCAKINSRK